MSDYDAMILELRHARDELDEKNVEIAELRSLLRRWLDDFDAYPADPDLQRDTERALG